MRIGLTFTSREQHGYRADDLRFTDFMTLEHALFIKQNLEQCGHDTILIGSAQQMLQFHNAGYTVDLVFNMDWGFNGRNREGNTPALLDVLGIPYTGTDAFGCSLCLSKVHTKVIAQHLGIPTPPFFVVSPTGSYTKPEDIPLHFPVVVKPSEEGSSMGVTLVEDIQSFREVANTLTRLYPGPIISESYIKGREVAVPLLETGDGVVALGVIETILEDGSSPVLFDAKLKTTKKYKKQLASLSPEAEHTLIQYSIDIFRFLGGEGFGRADFRIAEDGTPYFLEMAPLPALSETGSYCACIGLTGRSIPDVLGEIVNRAREKYNIV